MTRSIARQIAVRICFSVDFDEKTADEIINDFFDDTHYSSLAEEDELFIEKPDKKQMKYISDLISTIYGNISIIDNYISKYSINRKINRISGTARAILRCAVCEILFFDDIPESVSINEAINIAKHFDTQETVSFINGILGSLSKELAENNQNATE